MHDYDNAVFQEVKAIIERRFARRLSFIRRVVIGSLVVIASVFICVLATELLYQALNKHLLGWEAYNNVRHLIDVIEIMVLIVIAGWVVFGFFGMLAGNAKDRTLQREIDEEREWRLQQWETRVPYALTDDGEIEERIELNKRKRTAYE